MSNSRKGGIHAAPVINPEVLPSAAEAAAERAIAWHNKGESCKLMRILCAANAGAELIESKAQAKHGEWGGIRDKMPFSQNTVSKYMRFAPKLRQALQAHCNGRGKTLLEQFTEEEGVVLFTGELATDVLPLLEEFADGRSLTDLYRDFGIIKTGGNPHLLLWFAAFPEKLEHYSDQPGSAKDLTDEDRAEFEAWCQAQNPDLTPAQQQEVFHKAALEFWGRSIDQLEKCTSKGNWIHLKHAEKLQAIDRVTGILDELKNALPK